MFLNIYCWKKLTFSEVAEKGTFLELKFEEMH